MFVLKAEWIQLLGYQSVLQYECLGVPSMPTVTAVPLVILRKGLVYQVVLPCAASVGGWEQLCFVPVT